METFIRRARNLTHILLCRWIGEGPPGIAKRTAIRLLSHRILRPVAIGREAEQNFQLETQSSFTVSCPAFYRKPPIRKNGTFPAIHAHLVRNATVSPYASGAIKGNLLLMPEVNLAHRGRHATDGGNLFWLGKKNCLSRSITTERIPEGLLIGGAGAFNWYHFVMECLPKAYLAQHLPSTMDQWPLLVPSECHDIPGFKEALACFSTGRPVRTVPRDAALQVDRVIVFDEVNYGPFNLHRGFWPEIKDYSQHDDLLRAFLSKFRSELLAKSTPRQVQPRRIFLVRPSTRRTYNQDALVAIAARYGFEPQAPETLSLSEQAHLFAEAEMIVGASGAAWVGMAFCTAPTRMLSWLPKEYSEFCSYATLAHLLGHKLDFLEAIPDRALKDTADAYRHGYRLDEDDFETALKYMVDTVGTSASK